MFVEKSILAALGALGTGMLLAAGAQAAAVWPTDWVPLKTSGLLYSDDTGDQNPSSIDLVGGNDGFGDYSAGAWSISGVDDQVSLRMRLDGDGSVANSVWQFLLETDGDPMNVEWAIVVRQSGNPSERQVLFTRAVPGGPNFEDIVLDPNPIWTGALTAWSRWSPTGDGSNFDGDPDSFLDVAMPLTVFRAATGLVPGDTFRVALASSTSHSQVNKDLPLTLAGSDPVGGGLTTPVPETGSGALASLGLVLLAIQARRTRHLRTA